MDSQVQVPPGGGNSGASVIIAFRPQTTDLGYENRNGQIVLDQTDKIGNGHNQLVYVLGCSLCDEQYGSNGCDNFQRKCPNCQGGKFGLSF